MEPPCYYSFVSTHRDYFVFCVGASTITCMMRDLFTYHFFFYLLFCIIYPLCVSAPRFYCLFRGYMCVFIISPRCAIQRHARSALRDLAMRD